MKKTIIYTLLVFVAASSFAQQTKSTQTFTRQDYLQKSKNQKTAAWILLGSLPVLGCTGLYIGNRKESTFNEASTGAIIGGIGFLAGIGSIPFFISAEKNKKRAMGATSYFKMETAPANQPNGIGYASFPAISVRISF